MSLVRQQVLDNSMSRSVMPGDLIANCEVILTNATVGATTLTGANLTSGILLRSGSVGAFADTVPTSNDLVSALLNNNYLGSGAISAQGIANGTSFRFRYINSVAFVSTITTNTGVTLGSNTAVAASSVKDYLITVTNGTPARIIAGNTTNASAVVTGMDAGQLQFITTGMLVTGTGIAASTTVASVQPGVGVTLSANATATNVGTALTFLPTYRVDSIGQMLL